MRRARRFVEFLGERGIIQRKSKLALPTLDRPVVEFQDWLRQHRGVTELTIDRHGRMVMRLLPALGSRPRSWNAQLIRDVIIAEMKRVSLAYVKTMTMALRGYLRFLSARGLCRAGLDRAVPIIPQWRLSSLPRYISSSDVETLIATCDRTTATGVRDRAILLRWHDWACGPATFSRFVSPILIGNKRRWRFVARGGGRRDYHCRKTRAMPCSLIWIKAGRTSPMVESSSRRMHQSGH